MSLKRTQAFKQIQEWRSTRYERLKENERGNVEYETGALCTAGLAGAAAGSALWWGSRGRAQDSYG